MEISDEKTAKKGLKIFQKCEFDFNLNFKLFLKRHFGAKMSLPQEVSHVEKFLKYFNRLIDQFDFDLFLRLSQNKELSSENSSKTVA